MPPLAPEHPLLELFPPGSPLLENVAVELLLPVAEKLANHLPAQALALQDEVSDPDWRVREEPSLNEVLDPLLRLPVGMERKDLESPPSRTPLPWGRWLWELESRH